MKEKGKKDKNVFWSNFPEIIKAIATILTAIGGLAGLILALNEVGAFDRYKSKPPFVLDLQPECGTTYTVEAGKPIELHYGLWYANGLALATDNANHLTATLFIDNRRISGVKQKIHQLTPSWYLGAYCGSQEYSADSFGTYFIANIDALDPGEHSVQVIYSFDKEITDGTYDDAGNPIFYGPGDLEPLHFFIVASP